MQNDGRFHQKNMEFASKNCYEWFMGSLISNYMIDNFTQKNAILKKMCYQRFLASLITNFVIKTQNSKRKIKNVGQFY